MVLRKSLSQKRDFLTGVLLFLLPFLLALWLRLSLVGERLPFWYDEIWTANYALFSVPLERVVSRIREEDFHPPLSYLLYRLWAEVWGLRDPLGHRDEGAEMGLRLLSALLGAGTAGLTALLARASGAAFPLALGAGALYALAPIALVRDTEPRPYPVATFWVALALLLWVRGRKVGFALAATLALYSHYLASLLLLPPALRLRAFGLLPYALFLPWALWAVRGQVGVAKDLNFFNGLPQEKLPAMVAFAYAPEASLVGVGAFLWATALLSALTPKGKPLGLTLLWYVGAWLLLLPLLTGFNAYAERYAVLPLPLVLVASAVLLSSLRPGVVRGFFLLPLVAWALAFPLAQVRHLEYRTQALLAEALLASPGYVLATGKPLAVTAKYVCRPCEVETYSFEGRDRLLKEGGYLYTASPEVLAAADPAIAPLVLGGGVRLGEQEGVYLFRITPLSFLR
ncbi:MAG: phospholipid carrier-dependent glycosyltransferase [Thermus sp.]|nr:phospholipid carrier-dependent glycosyltransferase [Thermus sp.]